MATVAAAKYGTVKKVSQSILGVSEPPPSHFGNDANELDSSTWTNANWLKSRFHFSFAEYNNPKNSNFGVLRVMNDDLVQPKRGFGTHGHRDAEICTYVIEGDLTHEDSMGTAETIPNGAIQFMTAGSGVRHSEFNNSPSPLRFIQMWLTPRQRGLPPNYGSSAGDVEKRQNKWHHMVSDVQNEAVTTDVNINTDANMYATELDNETEVVLEIETGRQAYMLCIDGTTLISSEDHPISNGVTEVCEDDTVTLQRHDAVELFGPLRLIVQGQPATHVLVVEMANDGRGGRRDI